MIEAHNLTRRFGAFTAVERVSLRVPAGAILALLGPNGAGKTTTVRMLAGLIAPSQGDATVAGYDIRRAATEVRAHVGLMTDAPGLYEQMDARAYLDFFGRIYGLSAADRARRIGELLTLFDLDAHAHHRMAGFSKGMKQKVALARALLHEPAVLFLDEPTAGLDPLAARAVRALILTLKRANRAIVLCTHDLDEAERLADEVAIMRQGRIVVSDAPELLRARAAGGATVRIELAEPANGALDAMIKTLADVPGVLSAGVAGVAAPTLEYRTSDPHRANPEAIARLVAAGARIVSVLTETLSLEDVYASVQADGASSTAAGVATSATADIKFGESTPVDFVAEGP